MRKSNKPEKDFKCDVKQVLIEKDFEKRLSRLQIVHWIVDGKDFGPTIEKREFTKNESGDLRMGKRMGLKREDLECIAKHWDEIEMFFPV